jgi:hypothetical protein
LKQRKFLIMCVGDSLIGTTVLTHAQTQKLEVLIVNNIPQEKAIEMKIEIQEVEHERYFEPKKLHPKHQKGNKYRFNK